MAESKNLLVEEAGDSSLVELDLDDPQVFTIMKALSSKTRLKILRISKNRFDVCQIAKELKQTEANVSAQIKILEKARLIMPKYEAGRHGVKKICEPYVERIIINI